MKLTICFLALLVVSFALAQESTESSVEAAEYRHNNRHGHNNHQNKNHGNRQKHGKRNKDNRHKHEHHGHHDHHEHHDKHEHHGHHEQEHQGRPENRPNQGRPKNDDKNQRPQGPPAHEEPSVAGVGGRWPVGGQQRKPHVQDGVAVADSQAKAIADAGRPASVVLPPAHLAGTGKGSDGKLGGVLTGTLGHLNVPLDVPSGSAVAKANAVAKAIAE